MNKKIVKIVLNSFGPHHDVFGYNTLIDYVVHRVLLLKNENSQITLWLEVNAGKNPNVKTRIWYKGVEEEQWFDADYKHLSSGVKDGVVYHYYYKLEQETNFNEIS